jgi:hypothetical protein
MRDGKFISRTRSFEVVEGEAVEFWYRRPLISPIYVAALFKRDLAS